MIDLHRLRVFRAVVSSGSIQAASRNLGFTASAISQQVATLQKETGLTLLVPSGRGIAPTPAGIEVADLAGDLLAAAGRVEERIRDLREGRAGVLRLSYFDSVGQAWMPHVVRETARAFPDLRLELLCREAVPAAADPEVDLHVVVGAPDLEAPLGLTAHHLVQEPYVACLPAGHPLADRDVIDLADLADETWIDSDPGGYCRARLLAACGAAGFSPRFGVETGDHVTALHFVDVGVGIAVEPELCLLAKPPRVRAVRVRNPEPTRTIWALVNQGTRHPEAVEIALRALTHCAGAEAVA